MNYMGIPTEDATKRDTLMQDILGEMKSLEPNISWRLTRLDYVDSTGTQYGVRFHDDTWGVHYMLYSYFDWQQLIRFLRVTGMVSPSLYIDPISLT